ncbi:hypothetical protein QQY66_11395 [Streptomyces sp. DG2A-72]|uniref:hypothetical protein n=1 Tax=Streptomyces sp. DG2A-72 TaxID=3051386 RepID=UPI00265C89CD|nr:hypothetical protein [Streptomyces sp. DG2A-72]MDO0932262.1 hypothetical protein [Streptomyces sp. DG2A-72]
MKEVTFSKSGTEVPADDILKMEVRRARQMMALLARKLGPEKMADLFAEEIRENEEREQVWRDRSGDGFRESVAFAHVSEGSSAEFIEWFLAGYTGGNAPGMQRAHPEHLGAMPLPDGRIGILETPGHSETPALGHLTPLQDWSGIPIPLDPEMPHRIMGRGESTDGEATLYLLHQFRDTSPGFDARLAIYWRDGTPESMVRGHIDHLIVEFHNWFGMYLQTRRQPTDLMPVALSIHT